MQKWSNDNQLQKKITQLLRAYKGPPSLKNICGGIRSSHRIKFGNINSLLSLFDEEPFCRVISGELGESSRCDDSFS